MLANKQHMLIAFFPAILILVIVAITSIFFHVNIPSITRDVTAIAGIHPLSGFLSSLGILLWCATASVCFFSAIILRNYKQIYNSWFLLSSAFLTTYLLLDDLFLFHETLASMYLGVNEKIIFVVLGIAVFTYLAKYRRIILKTNYSNLLLALGFLSLSVVIDSILEPWLSQIGQWEFFLEDGFKWLGIVSWCSYYIDTSFLLISKVNENCLTKKHD